MENHEAQAPDAGRLPTGDLQGLLERAQARLIKLPHGTDIAPLASRAISALLRNIVTHHALVYRLRNDLSGLQDTDMLLQLVGAVAEEEPLTDKWALLRARGRQALNQLLESSGGSLAPMQHATVRIAGSAGGAGSAFALQLLQLRLEDKADDARTDTLRHV